MPRLTVSSQYVTSFDRVACFNQAMLLHALGERYERIEFKEPIQAQLTQRP